MPTYCYRSDSGKTAERRHSIHDDIPKTLRIDGEVYYRDFQAELTGTGRRCDLWEGYASDAMGCSISQIPEMKSFFAEQGIRADYTKDGRLICTSKRDRDRKAKALGLVDKAGHNEGWC